VGRVRILVVEDEVIVAQNIQYALQDLGYDVSAIALSGDEAVERVAELQPDLVLMDIKLQGEMSGVEAAERIRSRFDIPVIFVTAYADDQTLQRAKVAEPYGYVLKPFDERELRSTIEMALYRHEIGRKLRASETRLRTVFEATMDGLFTIDSQGRYVEVNPAGCRMFGYTREEILNSDIGLLLFPEDVEAVFSMLPSLLQEGTFIPECRMRSQAGSEIWVEMAVSPFKVGTRDLALCAKRDITERKRTAAALRESDLKHRTLFEAATDAIFLETLEGDILDCNRVACEMYGYTKEELLGLNVADLVPEKVGETLPNVVADELRVGGIFVEASQKRKDGTVFAAEISTRTVRLGEEQLVVAYVHDLTGRKQAEETLRQRAIQLALLNDIGSKIAAVLDLTSVLDRAARLVQEVFGYHHVALFTVDREQGELVMRAKSGAFTDLYPPEHRLKLGQGIVGWVAQHGERLLANDVSIEPRYVNLYPGVVPTQAELSVPIRTGEEIVGVLDVQSPHPNAFDDNDVMLIETVADQMAVAIQNARLFDEVRQRVAELETLQRTSLQFASPLDVTAVLESIVESALSIVGATDCYLYLYDEASETFTLGAERHEDVVQRPVIGTPRQDGLSVTVVRKGHPVVINDALSHSLYASSEAQTWNVHAIAGFPLKRAERVLGVFNVAFTRPHAFSENELRVLGLLAHQAAIAIENAYLFELEQRRWREAEALRKASFVLGSMLDTTQMLDQLLEQIHSVIPYDSANVMVIERGMARVTHQRGDKRFLAVDATDMPLLQVKQMPYLQRMLITHRPQIVPDTQADPNWVHLETSPWVRAWAGAPIVVWNEVIGFFSLNSETPGSYISEQAELLSAFAAHAAIAIENAQLVEGLGGQMMARIAELRTERDKSEAILHSVGDAICMTDLAMRIQYVNEAYMRLTGYAAEEAIGQLSDFALGAPLSDQDVQSLQGARARGEVWEGEVVFRRKDGRTYEAVLTITPLRDDQGRQVGYVSTHRDISQHKELDRARRRFMTHVSHELRTPVANMKLYTQLMRDGRRPDRVRHYLHVLNQQADRLADLIQDMLDMTELDVGRAVTTWGPVCLDTVVGDSVTRLQGRAEETGLTLAAKSIPPELPVVQGDQARLTQALNELVENAVVFTPPGGEVLIEVETAHEDGQQWVTIAVHDTGPGISPEEQERIFDYFYRGSLAESGHVPGTGLGLSIVKAIMDAHGGRVMVESKEGEGSTFTLWLFADHTVRALVEETGC
jgi:PAS domain S-box-containing protein